MKDTKSAVKRVFAIVSLVIAFAISVYIIIVDVSVFKIIYSKDTAALDVILSGFIGGAFTAILSVIGLAFSIFAMVLSDSKTLRILSAVLTCVTALFLVLGIALYRH
ncbi:MAG: hypothetical protein J5662_02365 [Clostridia bacterium]|nr:hypothetical protein [Clostridia bacterium]